MRNSTLTPCEAEVMNVVWSQRSVTVQNVVDRIPRQLAYTTVMTTMKILEEKGFVTQSEKRGRAFVYCAALTREAAKRSSVNELANRFFDGSVKSMVLSLIQAKEIKPEDIAELRVVMIQLEQSQ